jgi:hypothetical protein
MDPPATFSKSRFALERTFEQSRFASEHWAFVYELVLPVMQRPLSARAVAGARPGRRGAGSVSIRGGSRR